ncbi:hypothetical protein ACOME3_002527 [Neoechinorhynchus agilis]
MSFVDLSQMSEERFRQELKRLHKAADECAQSQNKLSEHLNKLHTTVMKGDNLSRVSNIDNLHHHVSQLFDEVNSLQTDAAKLYSRYLKIKNNDPSQSLE